MQHPIPLLRLHPHKQIVVDDAGIIHEYVNRPQLFLNLFDALLNGCGIGNIRLHSKSCAARLTDFLYHIVRLFLTAAIDDGGVAAAGAVDAGVGALDAGAGGPDVDGGGAIGSPPAPDASAFAAPGLPDAGAIATLAPDAGSPDAGSSDAGSPDGGVVGAAPAPHGFVFVVRSGLYPGPRSRMRGADPRLPYTLFAALESGPDDLEIEPNDDCPLALEEMLMRVPQEGKSGGKEASRHLSADAPGLRGYNTKSQ